MALDNDVEFSSHGTMAPVVGLPLDILRLIFEILARANQKAAASLSLVSRLVQRWIEPILYAVVWLNSNWQAERFLHAALCKEHAFFENVKVLTLTYSVARFNAAKILACCPQLEGLACWQPEPLDMPSIKGRSTIRRLSLNIHCDGRPFQVSCGPDFGLPLFSNVTHLELLDEPSSWLHWSNFKLVPNLTHLSLFWGGDELWPDPRAVPVPPPAEHARSLLKSCPNLKVLLYMFEHCDEAPSDVELLLLGEPRAVIMLQAPLFEIDYRRDWESQWYGERDRWKAAEEIVEKQIRLASLARS